MAAFAWKESQRGPDEPACHLGTSSQAMWISSRAAEPPGSGVCHSSAPSALASPTMLRIVAALAALAAAAASPMWEKVARAPKHETLDFTVATPMSNVDGLQA